MSPDDPDRKAERQAIEELHRRDEEASRKGDFATLRDLMDPEAVAMPPGGRLQRGAELQAAMEAMEAQYAQIEVLDYHLKFEEVEIAGDYAFEWGTIEDRSRPKGASEIESSRYHVLRVLRKREDGWKVYRTIWNEAGG